MTDHRSSPLTLIGLLLVLARVIDPSVAAAQVGNTNNNATVVPTQSPAGLASLAGGLALAGSWLMARRDRRK